MLRIRVSLTLGFLLIGIIAISALIMAQAPTATGPIMRFTATTANVSGAGDSVRIDVLAWSTDAQRDQLVSAWNLTAPAAGAARGGGGARGAGGGARGGGARGGGRGDAPPDAAAPDANAPAAAAPAAAAPAAGARGGRGGGGRGGAAPAPDAAPPTPEKALSAALLALPTVGYVWTSESAGYSLHYAYRLPQPDGGERIIFATDRRLGAWNDLWKPTGGASATDYEFSVIEVHLNSKGDGEGKASLTGKVAIDSTSKTIALDGYSTLPIIFKDVKRRSGN